MQIESSTGNGAERDLTLSERVAWTNAFERRMRRDGEGYVLELDVYPVDVIPDDTASLPAPAFNRGLSYRFLRLVSGSKTN